MPVVGGRRRVWFYSKWLLIRLERESTRSTVGTHVPCFQAPQTLATATVPPVSSGSVRPCPKDADARNHSDPRCGATFLTAVAVDRSV